MKQQSRSLIIGATGQIGRQMLSRLGDHALPTTRAADLIPGWLPLDLAAIATADDAERVLASVPLHAIFCLAGMTNVEACEDQQALATRVNTEAPGALAVVAARRGIPFVYFSTEYVFDGMGGPYLEEDDAHPLSVYGSSKWRGELAVREACPDALILRTTVVYGLDRERKNFVYGLMRKLAAGETMRVPNDQVSTPTYNVDLATVTQTLVERGASGIFHVCGPELLSRLEFARRVAEELGLDASLIEGVSTTALGQRAPRPLDAGLRIDKLRSLHPDLTMHTVAESFDDLRSALREQGVAG
ncbi:dTDP-4-dehydrorhamnose reductase [Granulicella pectinivorans]|uniref:dTDP-4-dehydrorhamnose reductase n=1 Tax=Granulicella pectinivorans TaxID=474950 RepID=A0A1I6KZV2_9BACT|nr:SDR family oxidoreductase [Granulicella pectinivorans]SFR96752.1 dTDP-4-dehydrorhamnose reductase [Granulicella pectinivorans]